jgi:AcrR family transcriptional regulator
VIGVDDQAPPRPRGRPRQADRDQRILDAATELLGEVGYDRLRMHDVAERAGVGLATIYRRWPTKQQLVIDGIHSATDLLDAIVLTGDPSRDLRQLLGAIAHEMCGKNAEMFPGFLAALREDEVLATAFRERLITDVRRHLGPVVAAALGPDHPELDLRTDLGIALLVFRVVLAGDDTEPDVLTDRVATIVLAGM